MFKLKTQITGSDVSAEQIETKIIVEKTFSQGVEDLAPDLLFLFVSEQIEQYRGNFTIVDKIGIRLTDENEKIILSYGDVDSDAYVYTPLGLETISKDFVALPEQPTRLTPSEIIPPVATPEPTFEKVANVAPKPNIDLPVFNHEKVESMDGKGASAKRMVTEASNKMVKAHLSRGDVVKFEVKRKLQHFKNLLPYNFGEIQAGYFYVNTHGEDQYDERTGVVTRHYLLDGAQTAVGDGESNLAVITEQEVDSLLASSDAWQVHSG